MTHVNADLHCSSLGGHLAVPRSQEQHQCVTDMTTFDWTWLGVTDLAVEGLYDAADAGADIPADAPFWKADEPAVTFADMMDCVSVFSGEWAVSSCDMEMASACQMPAGYLGICP